MFGYSIWRERGPILHLECDRERRTISINFLSNSDARVRNRWF